MIPFLPCQNDEEVEAFINQERTWDELAEQVEVFHNLSEEIPTSHDAKTQIGIFDVFCDELLKTLTHHAAEIRDKLLEKMIHELHGYLKE